LTTVQPQPGLKMALVLKTPNAVDVTDFSSWSTEKRVRPKSRWTGAMSSLKTSWGSRWEIKTLEHSVLAACPVPMGMVLAKSQ